MTWGQQNTEAEAHDQIGYALEHGILPMDAAEMYRYRPERNPGSNRRVHRQLVPQIRAQGRLGPRDQSHGPRKEFHTSGAGHATPGSI